MKIIRPIHAQVGDTVRIIWHGTDGQLTETHVAPPPDVWEVRMKQQQAVDGLRKAETPPEQAEKQQE